MALVELIGNTKLYLSTSLFYVHPIDINHAFKTCYSGVQQLHEELLDQLKEYDVLCLLSIPEQSVCFLCRHDF